MCIDRALVWQGRAEYAPGDQQPDQARHAAPRPVAGPQLCTAAQLCHRWLAMRLVLLARME